MKFFFPSLLIMVSSIFLSACEGAAEMPGCSDSMTQKGARFAIENSYINVGQKGLEGPLVSKLPDLEEFVDEAVARNLVRAFGLKSSADLRLCRTEMMKDAFMVVVIARNPEDRSQLGYVAYNIGIPNELIIGEGWLNF